MLGVFGLGLVESGRSFVMILGFLLGFLLGFFLSFLLVLLDFLEVVVPYYLLNLMSLFLSLSLLRLN